MTPAPARTRAPAPGGRLYPLLCRGWAAVFAAVLALILLAPHELAATLTQAGALAGLDGAVPADRTSLWYPLALSYMAVVAALAWACARDPQAPGAYRTLVLAKLASGAGLAALAWAPPPSGGSLWLVLGLGDGFVAASLWWMRRGWTPPGVPPGFLRARFGPGPWYEAWFGKLDLGPGRAFWFRYTLEAKGTAGDSKGTGTISGTKWSQSPVAAGKVWAVLFEPGPDGRPHTISAQQAMDPGALAPANLSLPPGDLPQVFWTARGDCLDPGRAAGSAGELSWDLRWTDSGRRLDHLPPLLRLLAARRSDATSPLLDLRVSGTVRCGEREIPVDGVTGMLGHHHGRRMARRWAWAHCNAFRDAPGAVFEGLSARVRLGPWTTPWISGFVLHLDGRVYDFRSSLRCASWDTQPDPAAGVWRFRAWRGGATLEGEAHMPAEAGARTVLEYTDTDGSRVLCTNSKLAALRLRIVHPAAGLDRELVSDGAAAFEWTERGEG